jgi:hypothetical protein
VLPLLIGPAFAAIAVVVATIAVLVVALAALVGLVRSVCRLLCLAKKTMDPLAERDSGVDRPPDRLRVLGRAHVTAFADDEPDEPAAILEDATRTAA